MKKIFLLFVVLPLLLVGHSAYAAVGDACDPTSASACLGTTDIEFCDQTSKTCQSADATPASSTAAPATAPASGAAGGGLNANAKTFVPLTQGSLAQDFTSVATSNTIDTFLQKVYQICIGLAAVLAVLQLVRAGVMYMGGDSVTQTKEARRLIGTALFGLLLVLSPVIVFSIINPSILSFTPFDQDIGKLGSSATPAAPAASTASGSSAAGAPGGTCTTDTDCEDASGVSYGCYQGMCTVDGDAPADGTAQPGEACTNDASCEDVNGQSYGCYQGTCTVDGDASASP